MNNIYNIINNKYVDETTVYTASGNADDTSLQLAAEDLVLWSHTNGLTINESNTEEMVIHFRPKFHKENDIPHTVINNTVIDHEDLLKLLGIYTSSHLS